MDRPSHAAPLAVVADCAVGAASSGSVGSGAPAIPTCSDDLSDKRTSIMGDGSRRSAIALELVAGSKEAGLSSVAGLAAADQPSDAGLAAAGPSSTVVSATSGLQPRWHG